MSEATVKLHRIQVVALIFLGSLISSAQDTRFPPTDQQIPAPDCLSVAVKDLWFPGSKLCGPSEHEAWLADICHWRDERRIRIGYDGSRYDRPEFKWTQSSFIQPQMMVHDRYFYDPVAGKYTVDRYLDDLGSVWQWTEEFVDEHTRAAIIRGGNYYQPQGAIWYFPEAYKLSEHGKLLLMSPSMDRSGTLGFRCVVDAR